MSCRTIQSFSSVASAFIFLLLSGLCQAQVISRDELVGTLQDGGFIIVMRHASSPRQLPNAETANPDNVNRERQLDETGRQDAITMGESLRRLMIPVAEVLSSPTYRTMETASLMGFMQVDPVEELGNEGMRDSGESKATWLREQAEEGTDGANRLLITHAPNVAAAFPEYSEDMTEGEALIFDPRGMEGPTMIQRIRIEAWAEL